MPNRSVGQEEPPVRYGVFVDRDHFRHEQEYSLSIWGIERGDRTIYTPPKEASVWVAHSMIEIKDESAFWDEWGKPLLRFDRRIGQVLIDELWRHGFRPTEMLQAVEGKKGIEAHLLDMRALVSRAYGLMLPGVEPSMGGPFYAGKQPNKE